MKSLLLKDYLFFKRHYFLISLICYFFIPIVTSFNYDVSYWGTVFPCAFANLFIIEALNQDSRINWNEFQAALPIKKSDVVSEKYLLAFMISLCTVLASLCAIGIKYLMSIYGSYVLTPGEVLGPFSTNAIIIIGNSIMLYLYYRSGMRSTKVLSMTTFFVAAVGGTGVVASKIFISSFEGIWLKVFLVLAVAIAVYAFSWTKAIKIYEKHGVR